MYLFLAGTLKQMGIRQSELGDKNSDRLLDGQRIACTLSGLLSGGARHNPPAPPLAGRRWTTTGIRQRAGILKREESENVKMEKDKTTDNYMNEIIAMANRFRELHGPEGGRLIGVDNGLDGPIIQLNDQFFKQVFSDYERNFSIHIKNPMLVAYLDGVKFIAIERSENVQV